MKNYVKSVIAIITGDDAEAKALKIQRQAESGLKTQIASLEGDTISFEDAVTDAEEALEKATFSNGELFTDRNQYVRDLIQCQNNLTTAKQNLEAHTAKLDFLKERLQIVVS